MDLFHQTGAAVILVTLTLALQCGGMAALIDWGIGHLARETRRLGPVRSTVLMVRLSTVMILLHILEILLWAAFYRWKCFGTWEAAFYFSTADYATVGCGDLFLPRIWRPLGPVEAITGVLMCGLTASLLFAIVTRLVDRELRLTAAPEAIRAGSSGHRSVRFPAMD